MSRLRVCVCLRASVRVHVGEPCVFTNAAFLSADLRNQPYRRADAVRRSVRRRFDDQNLRSANGAEITM